jgi:hypothetical protein
MSLIFWNVYRPPFGSYGVDGSHVGAGAYIALHATHRIEEELLAASGEYLAGLPRVVQVNYQGP